MDNYILVVGTMFNLQKRVNNKISEGYTPIGNPFQTGRSISVDMGFLKKAEWCPELVQPMIN